MKNILRQILIATVSATLCLSFATTCKGVEYKYIEILPEGWVEAFPTDINNNGVAVGCGTDSKGQQEVLFTVVEYTHICL